MSDPATAAAQRTPSGRFTDVPSWKWVVGVLLAVVAFFVALWMRNAAEKMDSLEMGQAAMARQQQDMSERLAAATAVAARNLAEATAVAARDLAAATTIAARNLADVDAARRERIAQIEGEQKSLAMWRLQIDAWCVRVEAKLDHALNK